MGKKNWEDVILSDNDIIPGKNIIKTFGGVKVMCKSQSVLVGAHFFYNKAPNKLKKVAYKLGANAITNVGFKGIRDKHLYYYGIAVLVEDQD